jgi:hypothetical protein
LLFIKAIGADGAIPPGFQFPVKELVASLNHFLRGVEISTPLF